MSDHSEPASVQPCAPITLRASVVIPCFNERDTVNELIDRVRAVPIDKEIIVVDDCSTDGTRELLQQRVRERGDIIAAPARRAMAARAPRFRTG